MHTQLTRHSVIACQLTNERQFTYQQRSVRLLAHGGDSRSLLMPVGSDLSVQM